MYKTLCAIRNILFKAWILTIVVVIIAWLFFIAGLMQHFMWALPGFTIAEANEFLLKIVALLDVAGLVLFLIPAAAIHWHLYCYKKTDDYKVDKLYDDMEKDAVTEFSFDEWAEQNPEFFVESTPAKKTAAKKKPAAKKKKK